MGWPGEASLLADFIDGFQLVKDHYVPQSNENIEPFFLGQCSFLAIVSSLYVPWLIILGFCEPTTNLSCLPKDSWLGEEIFR
jgi:hypothetical protein